MERIIILWYAFFWIAASFPHSFQDGVIWRLCHPISASLLKDSLVSFSKQMDVNIVRVCFAWSPDFGETRLGWRNSCNYFIPSFGRSVEVWCFSSVADADGWITKCAWWNGRTSRWVKVMEIILECFERRKMLWDVWRPVRSPLNSFERDWDLNWRKTRLIVVLRVGVASDAAIFGGQWKLKNNTHL